MRHLIGPCFCVLFSMVMPALSLAQAPVHSLRELRARVLPGDAVRVTDTDGQEINGRVQGVSAESLNVTVDGRLRELREIDIREIRTRQPDKWWNGLLIGAGVGLGTGVVVTAASCQDDPECRINGAAAAIPFFTGAGAGVGALVDRLISQFETVYERSAASVRVDLAPILSHDTRGVRFSLSF